MTGGGEMGDVCPVLPPRFSMTFMRRAGECLRAAQLDKEADTAGEDAAVGRTFHEIASTAGLYARYLRVETLSAAVLDDIARRVIRSPEEPDALSEAAWLRVRELVRLFAREHRFPGGAEYEVLSHERLAGRTLSARMDVREIVGDECWIEDYKTGGRLPAAGDPLVTFQGRHYAWHTRRAHPEVEVFHLTENFVRYGRRRTGTLYAGELDEHEEYLVDHIARIVEAYGRGGGLKPRPGSACGTCPDPLGCPLPPWAKAGSIIASDADAVEVFKALLVDGERAAKGKAMIEAWLVASGRRAITTGGREIGFKRGEGDTTSDTTRFGTRKARGT